MDKIFFLFFLSFVINVSVGNSLCQDYSIDHHLEVLLRETAALYPYEKKAAFEDRLREQIRTGVARGTRKQVYIAFLQEVHAEYRSYRQQNMSLVERYAPCDRNHEAN